MYVEFDKDSKFGGKNPDMSDDLTHFHDAGYLLTDEDLVVDIDCLQHDQITRMLNWFDIHTQTVWTDRGVHLYFKKPLGFRGRKSMTMLGFEVEYKHSKNTKATTVKIHGRKRPVDNEGIRTPLPNMFKPTRKVDLMLGLSEGDGRNDALFKLRKTIAGEGNWQQILGFVNDVIFEEPLPQSEFDVITRDGVTVEGSKDGENIVAETMIRELSAVSYNGHVWFRPSRNEWYINDETELKRVIYGYIPTVKSRYIEEVVTQMKLRSPVVPSGTVFDIRLRNGVLRDGQFLPIESDEFTPYSIELKYDPNTPPDEMVDEYLDNLSGGSRDYRTMIEEILGYTLFTDKEAIRLVSKFFFFIGDGGNGKGTLLTIIRRILGTSNCGSLSIDEIADEKYNQSLDGTLVNLGDDVEDAPINEKKMKILKNISTADSMSMRRLYEQSYNVELATTLIFTTNHVLKSFEKGESYKRRVVWCPMYSKPKKKDPRFISNITSKKALAYWIKLIVEGYKRLYVNMEFTESDAVKKFNEDYHEDNNSVLEYLKNTTPMMIEGKTGPEAYEIYEDWAVENDYSVQSKRQFKETVQNIAHLKLKVKTINGKSKRVYAQIS